MPLARVQVVAEQCVSLVWPAATDAHGQRQTDDREALFSAWLDGFDAFAPDSTQVWLVEDVHWAGGDELAFLDLAASRPSHGGRLIIATARPSLLETRSEWANDDVAQGRHVQRLATLEAASAHALVGALVGNALPDELVDRIVERSDGNCLFIEELLRTWVSVGTLVADGGQGWRLAVPADDVPLPESVQAIYTAQLDDLPPDARRLARRASVAGRRFPVRALEALDAAAEGLDPLRRRELVTGPVAEPILGDAFSYRHALLRDAGYASLARAERARLHARLARWLEQAAGERSNEVAGQIAAHYAAALESAPALAVSIDDGLDREQTRSLAAEWFERAGQAALAIAAHDAARQLFRRALDLTEEDDLLNKAHRWSELGDATAYSADMSEGGAAYQTAVDLFEQAVHESRTQPALDGLARATASLADVWYQQLRFAESRDLSTRILDQLPDASAEATARLLIARGLGQLGAVGPSDPVRVDLVRATELAEQAHDRALLLRAKDSLATYRSEIGQYDVAEWYEIADEAVAVGDPQSAVAALLNVAIAAIDDAPRNIHEPLVRAHEIAIAHGLVEDDAWVSVHRMHRRLRRWRLAGRPSHGSSGDGCG